MTISSLGWVLLRALVVLRLLEAPLAWEGGPAATPSGQSGTGLWVGTLDPAEAPSPQPPFAPPGDGCLEGSFCRPQESDRPELEGPTAAARPTGWGAASKAWESTEGMDSPRSKMVVGSATGAGGTCVPASSPGPDDVGTEAREGAIAAINSSMDLNEPDGRGLSWGSMEAGVLGTEGCAPRAPLGQSRWTWLASPHWRHFPLSGHTVATWLIAPQMEQLVGCLW